MLIENLNKKPKEDDLTEILFDIFVKHPNLFTIFLQKYASINDFKSNNFKSELWKDLTVGIPDMYFENDSYALVFENKLKAGFSKEQLPRYIEGSKAEGKINKYFLIAPDTTRYKHGDIPQEYIKLTWDVIYDFLQSNLSIISQSHQVIIENILSRYRYLYYCDLFNRLYKQISSQTNIYSPELFSKDDYHSRHISLNNYENLNFSIGIYLDAPSYIKLNPWWVKTRSGNFKIIETLPQVRAFRERLKSFPKTSHSLVKSAPGYVIDIKLSESNTEAVITSEIVGLINNECQEIIRLYQSMNL
ncbi:MAG: PD-(D/E)XK nuclease family protein [Bacteroidetes bacterium]|nr:PD-(D/E)XK nuclease family protein [Bacteroidota bacterium]